MYSENPKCHVLKVNTLDIANGPGIRVSVWVAGCEHRCKGCHNPETWKWKQGKELTQELIDKILKACEPEYIQGLTLTGGDPLFPHNELGIYDLCWQFRQKFRTYKDIWMWTGYTWEATKHLSWLGLVDVIVDGKYIESQKDVSLKYAGSKNQRIINVKEEIYKCRDILLPVKGSM